MVTRLISHPASAEELHTAQRIRAIDHALESRDAVAHRATAVDVVLLATPVLPIMDWMERLAPSLSQRQLVTDVGSTKREIVNLARTLFNQPGRARFLPGHPMAGKESGGATLAEPTLFRDATWLFTPCDDLPSELERDWRLGAQVYNRTEHYDRLAAGLPALLEQHRAA